LDPPYKSQTTDFAHPGLSAALPKYRTSRLKPDPGVSSLYTTTVLYQLWVYNQP
jgi:hypothetical protein